MGAEKLLKSRPEGAQGAIHSIARDSVTCTKKPPEGGFSTGASNQESARQIQHFRQRPLDTFQVRNHSHVIAHQHFGLDAGW